MVPSDWSGFHVVAGLDVDSGDVGVDGQILAVADHDDVVVARLPEYRPICVRRTLRVPWSRWRPLCRCRSCRPPHISVRDACGARSGSRSCSCPDTGIGSFPLLAKNGPDSCGMASLALGCDDGFSAGFPSFFEGLVSLLGVEDWFLASSSRRRRSASSAALRCSSAISRSSSASSRRAS